MIDTLHRLEKLQFHSFVQILATKKLKTPLKKLKTPAKYVQGVLFTDLPWKNRRGDARPGRKCLSV